jgi:hypothetical protein
VRALDDAQRVWATRGVIHFRLASRERVRVTVVDVTGCQVARAADGVYERGEHRSRTART